MSEKKTIRVSVRSLVEFLLRSGDLDFTSFGTVKALDAIRAHQRIQKSRPPSYSSEVPVSYTYDSPELMLEINGRIDGVYELGDKIIIDEIKTTSKDLDSIVEDYNPVHWGQAKCYAFMYNREKQLSRIQVQLTYCRLDTSESRGIQREFSHYDLERFFFGLADEYIRWAELSANWIVTRNESIGEIDFPFEVKRPGQDEMIEAVSDAAETGRRLIIQAPTGTGKTMAALYPAVKALRGEKTDKLFYLSARTTGKSVAEASLAVLRDSGLRLKSITLTAKEKICFNPGSACSPEECEYARGHFDRIKEALEDILHCDEMTRDAVESAGLKHRVCPFELSLDTALWADCIICDYNYVFDPRVYLRRFFEDETDSYVFLVDEAHNLPDRARDMFSAEIDKDRILTMRRRLKQAAPSLYKALGSINTKLLAVKKDQCPVKGESASPDAPSDLYPPLRKFIQAADTWLVLNRKAPFRDELLDVYFEIAAFLRISERFDKSYAACYKSDGRSLAVKLFCIDPAEHLREGIERARAAVFFSATLTPESYYSAMLGLEHSDRSIRLGSPFPAENLLPVLETRISTLYRHRNNTKCYVADTLESVINAQKGNYLVYFPSYDYLNMVLDMFKKRHESMDIIVQKRNMKEHERTGFIGRFRHDNTDTLAGFAVMGGVFGEGIDLIGDMLTGAVIVGVGMPGLSLERNLIREYYDKMNGDGFSYAYIFPGITKVLQAAGRVIRSERDKGVVCLIDKRYGEHQYKTLLPDEWNSFSPNTLEDLEKKLQLFWNNSNE